MKTKVFNIKKAVVPPEEQTLFLGDYSGFQRYDIYRYPQLKRIEEIMRNNFWNPEEISLTEDALKFQEFDEGIKEVFTQNLLYQTTMDSVQTRGLQAALLKVVSMPELESCINTQAYFEQIHSLSYSHIVRSLFPNGTEVFDKIDEIPAIKNRMNTEVYNYNFIASNEFDDFSIDMKRKYVFEMLIHIYAMESVKFYLSFLITYMLNDITNNSLQRTSRIIKMIQFDENLHVTLFRTLFNILKKNKKEGFIELFNYNKFISIFTKVKKDEIEWGKYLLSVYNIPGLTEKSIENFVNYHVDRSLYTLGMTRKKPVKDDLINWFNMISNIDSENVAQQEAESVAYQVGILKNDFEAGPLKI